MTPTRYYAYAGSLLCVALGCWLLLVNIILGKIFLYGGILLYHWGRPKKPSSWLRTALFFGVILLFIAITCVLNFWILPSMDLDTSTEYTPLNSTVMFIIFAAFLSYRFYREQKTARVPVPQPSH